MDGWIILDIDNPPTSLITPERPPSVNITKHQFVVMITERCSIISYPCKCVDYKKFIDITTKFVSNIICLNTLIHQIILHGYMIEELHKHPYHIPMIPTINIDFLIKSIQSLGLDRQIPKRSITLNYQLISEILWILYNHIIQLVSLGLCRRPNRAEVRFVVYQILDLITCINDDDDDQPLTTNIHRQQVITIPNFHEIKENLEKSLIFNTNKI